MTPLPPRRRQHPLHLDGAWLLTASPEGERQVPGMSVVADPKGFTLSGPDPGTERTIPWDQTTGFTCQRPARLTDGSPATVLEVGLANGRVLQLLLPVTRVPPSETVVVETELVVMAEQYGGPKPAQQDPQVQAPQTQMAPQIQTAQPKPQSEPAPSAPSVETAQTAQTVETVQTGQAAPQSSSRQSPPGVQAPAPRSNSPEPRPRTREQAPALALQGARTSGRSTGSSTSASPAPVAAVSSAPAPAAAVSSAPAPAAERVSAPPVSQAPETRAPETPAPEARAPEARQAVPAANPDEASQAAATERRENRMLTLLIALIGIVVVVLIAELVLILFVLNHNPSTKGQSIRSQTTTAVYYPRAVTRL